MAIYKSGRAENKKIFHKIFALILLFSMWWLAPSIFKSFAQSAVYEFSAPVWLATTELKNLEKYWILRRFSKKELIAAGRDLSRLNSAYEISLSENNQLRAENKRFELLFDLPDFPRYRYEVARVIHREMNTWWQQVVVDKGINYKIRPGMGVVFSNGIAGRVKEVHMHSSVVSLVSSKDFRVVANVLGDQRTITYQGYFNQPFMQPRGEVRDIPMDVTNFSKEPIRIVSSRLSGIFPEGIPIGSISHFLPSRNSLLRNGLVKLDAQLLNLSEVALLIPIQTDIIVSND